LKPKIILTFDLEEFDLPLEYNCPISEEQQFEVTNEGLLNLMALLKIYNVRSTFFITGNFCERNHQIVKKLSDTHEIGSHGYYHSKLDEEFIISSKKILETVVGKKISGFRMPLLQKVDYNLIKQAGYEYDSSINPTYLPGRYNHFGVSRTPYQVGNSEIIEFPVSVTPTFRFPLFWLSFKILPLFIYRSFCHHVIKHDHFLHLYFHPWEFANLDPFKIPGYIRNPNSARYIKKFSKLLKYLKEKGDFITASEFLRNYNVKSPNILE
jgi:peptidoglycan/xylan/chitin deacetylase (PgdA/CDA1 family)